MEVTPWLIYWVTRADCIHKVMISLAVICGVVGIALLVMYLLIDEWEDRDHEMRNRGIKYIKILLVVAVLATLVGISMPTTKELTAMLVIPEVVNSKVIQKLPDRADRLLDLLESRLNESDQKPSSAK